MHKEFRSLRRAAKGRCPLDTHNLLKNVDENFYVAGQLLRFCSDSHANYFVQFYLPFGFIDALKAPEVRSLFYI